jgi:protein-disulfide isomerase
MNKAISCKAALRRSRVGRSVLWAAAVFLLVFGPAAATAGESSVDEERLKAIVIEVIQENPKLIMDTLNQYVADQKKMQQEQQLDASFDNRLRDTVSEAHPQKGPADAPVTIIEYTDFQCPYCARGAETLRRVREMYPQKVRVVFKNLPLKMHAQAEPAARAALAAHRQGKFWEYHDLLFQKASGLHDGIYAELAADLDLNVEQFQKDMASVEVAALVRADQDQAGKLGLNGTPRFLVNGVQIRGAYPPEYFAQVIDRLLAEMGDG